MDEENSIAVARQPEYVVARPLKCGVMRRFIVGALAVSPLVACAPNAVQPTEVIVQTCVDSRLNPSVWTHLIAPPPNAFEIRRAAHSGTDNDPQNPRSPEVWFAAGPDRYLLCYPRTFNNCGAIDAYVVSRTANAWRLESSDVICSY